MLTEVSDRPSCPRKDPKRPSLMSAISSALAPYSFRPHSLFEGVLHCTGEQSDACALESHARGDTEGRVGFEDVRFGGGGEEERS